MNSPTAVRHLRGLALALAAGVFLALAGAFETGQTPLLIRLAYWLGVMTLGTVGGVVLSSFIERGPLEERPWLQGTLAILLLSLPMTVVIWLVTGLTFGNGVAEPESLPNYLLPVLIVTTAMTVLNYAVQRTPAETHASAPGSAPPRFLDRLPAKLRGADLYAVQAEDHYLRLHTSRGQDLILMRLSDAVAELEGIEGAQTHRSWWVARAAVEDARRGDGRATLLLKGGAQAPVSRAYAKALREAGWY
jgi:hypothetical protein